MNRSVCIFEGIPDCWYRPATRNALFQLIAAVSVLQQYTQYQCRTADEVAFANQMPVSVQR